MTETDHYEGTEIEVVPANNPIADRRKYAVGIVHKVSGKGFGYYADCGIVHTECKQ